MMIRFYSRWAYCAAAAAVLAAGAGVGNARGQAPVQVAQKTKDDVNKLQRELDALRAEFEQRAKELAKERERAEKKEKEKKDKGYKGKKEHGHLEREMREIEETLRGLRRDVEKLAKKLDALSKSQSPPAPPRVIYVPVPVQMHQPFFTPFDRFSPFSPPMSPRF